VAPMKETISERSKICSRRRRLVNTFSSSREKRGEKRTKVVAALFETYPTTAIKTITPSSRERYGCPLAREEMVE
jgi:hypothetical protein